MSNPIMQLLAQLQGSAPNQEIPGEGGFAVQPPQAGGNVPDQSAFVGDALNQLQQAGVAPPMPAETGGGPETMMVLMQLLQAIQSASGPVDLPGGGNDGGAVPLPGPKDASVGGDPNRALLQKLLGGGG